MATKQYERHILQTLLLTLGCLVGFVGAAPSPCPPNYRFYENTGFCCEITTCGKFQHVVQCIKDGEKDSCRPCPPHTYMFDNTTSHQPFECVPYGCDPVKTKETNISARDLDPVACRKFCQCDMSKDYCGTDPCQCQPITDCGYGKKRNQQCWCVLHTTSTIDEKRLLKSDAIPSTTSLLPSEPFDARDRDGIENRVSHNHEEIPFPKETDDLRAIIDRPTSDQVVHIVNVSATVPTVPVLLVILSVVILLLLVLVFVLYKLKTRNKEKNFFRTIIYRFQNAIFGGNDNTVNNPGSDDTETIDLSRESLDIN